MQELSRRFILAVQLLRAPLLDLYKDMLPNVICNVAGCSLFFMDYLKQDSLLGSLRTHLRMQRWKQKVTLIRYCRVPLTLARLLEVLLGYGDKHKDMRAVNYVVSIIKQHRRAFSAVKTILTSTSLKNSRRHVSTNAVLTIERLASVNLCE